MPKQEPRPLIDKVAAAEYLGVSVKWIDARMAERSIAFIKLGRHVRFDPDYLDGYIAKNTIVPGGRRAG